MALSEEKPTHPVTLTQPYYLGKFSVTQEQYQAVMSTNPSGFTGTDHPVETVTWDAAQAFCKTLSEQTKQTVRLPTEAEWEYACRAGTTTEYYSGDTEADLQRVAWYMDAKKHSHPVGAKLPNAFGLYDMHGNVMQWCLDWYGDDYYEKTPGENPPGPATGIYRVLRGGSWCDNHRVCRSAFRYKFLTDRAYNHMGFRVVVSVDKAP